MKTLNRLFVVLWAAVIFLAVLPAARANGGSNVFSSTAGVTNTAVLATGSPGILSEVTFSNPNATVVYIQVFDAATAGAVIVGTTVPKFVIPLAASATNIYDWTPGPGFTLGIVIAVTLNPTGNTTPGTAVPLTVFFL